MTADAADVELAGRLVTEAGRLAQRMRVGGLTTKQKSGHADVVTEADHAAERHVRGVLARERPDDGLLGEEETDQEGRSGRRWVVDPVDGTWNFVNGLDWWCSAIALTDGDDLLLGAVYHPHDDELYVGGPDLPTTCNGEPLPSIEDRPLATSCVSTYLHPPLYGGAVGAAFARALAGAATLRMLGSGSMDFTAVARGIMHVMVQQSVATWDWLPGSALVRGAGGEARRTTAAGVEWSVAGAPTAVAEIVEALRGGETQNR
ncbi:MAG TPA: inositol monophosphatase [Marmoricola sp.]|nr:inositol monophosphatase [Marmoricola sp.]